MSSDLTGGYDTAFDYPLSGCPDNPRMRDSVSMWIQNSSGDFGLPRFCIEAVAGDWHNRGIQANIAFPDGRVLVGAGGFDFAPPVIRDGRQVTLNAGPLTFELIEPMRHWRMTFDGSACETSVLDQAKGVMDGPRRHVRIAVDAYMAVPPWIMGEQLAGQTGATAKAVGAVGGHRHEQLFRCTGTMEIGGEPERRIEGTGLRIRRYGDRDVGEFPGHCWMSALFPSGKAFGINTFPPRPDGTPSFSEAYTFDGRTKKYGKVIEAPWMTRFEPHDSACDLLLEMSDGERVAITGRTRNSTFIAKGTPMFGNWTYGGGPHGVALPFHQGDALYTMNGESAFGMIERSLPLDKWEVVP